MMPRPRPAGHSGRPGKPLDPGRWARQGGAVTVLVVGAGPAGLVTALGLARRDVPVRIVDSAPRPAPGSRAKGLQPRTLEVLEALGVVEEVLAAGGRFPRWRNYRAGRVAWEKSVYELLGRGEPAATADVPYPETWMVPQWRTEEVLRRALARSGVEVEYGRAVTALDAGPDGVTAAVTGFGPVSAEHVVAADGAASTVRTLLGVPFPGTTRAEVSADPKRN